MYPAALSTAQIALILVAVLAWLGCALYAGGVARNNGESYQLWFVIGLLAGPVGLVVCVLFFRTSGERRRRMKFGSPQEGNLPEMTRCPRCNRSVPVSFEQCQFCGEPLGRKKR